MKKLEGKCIIWPPYLDQSKPSSQGRKVSKRLALQSPHLDEIVEAARNLNLKPELSEAKYPRSWWQKSGYVTINKLGSKNKTLIALAKKINESRRKKEISRKV